MGSLRQSYGISQNKKWLSCAWLWSFWEQVSASQKAIGCWGTIYNVPSLGPHESEHRTQEVPQGNHRKIHSTIPVIRKCVKKSRTRQSYSQQNRHFVKMAISQGWRGCGGTATVTCSCGNVHGFSPLNNRFLTVLCHFLCECSSNPPRTTYVKVTWMRWELISIWRLVHNHSRQQHFKYEPWERPISWM